MKALPRNTLFVQFAKREISLSTKAVKSSKTYSRKDKRWRKEVSKQMEENK